MVGTFPAISGRLDIQGRPSTVRIVFFCPPLSKNDPAICGHFDFQNPYGPRDHAKEGQSWTNKPQTAAFFWGGYHRKVSLMITLWGIYPLIKRNHGLFSSRVGITKNSASLHNSIRFLGPEQRLRRLRISGRCRRCELLGRKSLGRKG